MRKGWSIFLLGFLSTQMFGQIRVDQPLRFTGYANERGIYDLPSGDQGSSLITVEGTLIDQLRLATVTPMGDTLLLTTHPSIAAPSAGLLLRFVTSSELAGDLWISLNGSAPSPLVRIDGTSPTRGQIVQGSICEVIATNDAFVLLSPTSRGCPAGTLPITERSCMAVDRVLGLDFYQAIDHCAAQGGTLCSWGEYAAGCSLIGGQLNSMFTHWEWTDETSNHTHTADQAGRTTCMSQRSSGPLVPGGSTRCCYRPR